MAQAPESSRNSARLLDPVEWRLVITMLQPRDLAPLFIITLLRHILPPNPSANPTLEQMGEEWNSVREWDFTATELGGGNGREMLQVAPQQRCLHLW